MCPPRAQGGRGQVGQHPAGRAVAPGAARGGGRREKALPAARVCGAAQVRVLQGMYITCLETMVFPRTVRLHPHPHPHPHPACPTQGAVREGAGVGGRDRGKAGALVLTLKTEGERCARGVGGVRPI